MDSKDKSSTHRTQVFNKTDTNYIIFKSIAGIAFTVVFILSLLNILSYENHNIQVRQMSRINAN